MSSEILILAMSAHIAWVALLYVVLTLVRAPAVWRIGQRPDGTNPWADVEPRVSANLRNQFEWPLLFYAACLLLMFEQDSIAPIHVWAAWAFVAGRIVHSAVQILTTNIRLRGIVFTINFAAVLVMWGRILIDLPGELP